MNKRRAVFVALALLALIVPLAARLPAALANPAPFTLVALPDTQKYIRYDAPSAHAAIFKQQTQWIVDNIGQEQIVFVTHEGDVVETGGEYPIEWQRADEAVDLLDGVVPYAVVYGNHDFEHAGHRSSGTASYLRYFGPDRYAGYSWFGGASANGLNTYQLFQGGGWTFLHLALELEVPDGAIAWAKQVIAAHPGMPTIVTTHSYQRDDSGRTTKAEFGGNSGQQIWDKLIKPNPQIFMVLNGHFTKADGERHQVSRNSAGLEVYEMVADYQDYPYGGNGYLRLIRFDPAQGQIQVRSYSPRLNNFMTDGDSQFSFAVDFDERFGNLAAPTLTPTPGDPPTPTLDATPNASVTPSPTETPSPSPTPTATPQPGPERHFRHWLLPVLGG